MTLRSTSRLARRDETSGNGGAIRARMVTGRPSLEERPIERDPADRESTDDDEEEDREMEERGPQLRRPEGQVAGQGHPVVGRRDEGDGLEELRQPIDREER